ncbi:MAG TPA: hypothetical protein PKU74_08230, partial [Candidatus Omnitrophota bacterium]|nr:hypothetical protein [Candidatus Omnitrophota bacterium]
MRYSFKTREPNYNSTSSTGLYHQRKTARLFFPMVETAPAAGIEVEVYPPVSLLTGRHANNPWLQEMPDPVTKAVWENYAAISPKF